LFNGGISWSLTVWMQGYFPHFNHEGESWNPRSWRAAFAKSRVPICGGHVAVYVSLVGDQAWIREHMRFSQCWSSVQCCHRCVAEDRAGPLNFNSHVKLPSRCTNSYLASAGGILSPLSEVPGFALETIRGELMHCGALGAMADAVGSALVELLYISLCKRIVFLCLREV